MKKNKTKINIIEEGLENREENGERLKDAFLQLIEDIGIDDDNGALLCFYAKHDGNTELVTGLNFCGSKYYFKEGVINTVEDRNDLKEIVASIFIRLCAGRPEEEDGHGAH